jgi:hypothetical protein
VQSASTAVESGASFGEVCARADAVAAGGDMPRLMAEALGRWLANGWLAGFEAAG